MSALIKKRVFPQSLLESNSTYCSKDKIRKKSQPDHLEIFINKYILLPSDVNSIIRSYLPELHLFLPHLAPWRAANKKAFQDVEDLVKKTIHALDIFTVPRSFSFWVDVNLWMMFCESCKLFFSEQKDNLCEGCVNVCNTCVPQQDYCPSCDRYFCTLHESFENFFTLCGVCNIRVCQNCDNLTSCLSCEYTVCNECVNETRICFDCVNGFSNVI
jgi:hypothetical protein